MSVLKNVPPAWVIGAACAAFVSCSGTALYQVHAWKDRAVSEGKTFTRDSLVKAQAKVARELAPKIETRTIEVVKWREKIVYARDSMRVASVRVDTAIVRLSESAQSDTTVGTLVTAVHELQADTTQLYASLRHEQFAQDSLRIDFTAALDAVAARIVSVQDSAKRAFDVEAARPKRTKKAILTAFGSGVGFAAVVVGLIALL